MITPLFNSLLSAYYRFDRERAECLWTAYPNLHNANSQAIRLQYVQILEGSSAARDHWNKLRSEKV